MTLGDAIKRAHETAYEAERKRNELLAHARAQGVSVTELGELLGVSRETAWRWSGGKTGRRGKPSPLLADLPSVTARPGGTILLETAEIGPRDAPTSEGRGSEPLGGPEHG